MASGWRISWRNTKSAAVKRENVLAKRTHRWLAAAAKTAAAAGSAGENRG